MTNSTRFREIYYGDGLAGTRPYRYSPRAVPVEPSPWYTGGTVPPVRSPNRKSPEERILRGIFVSGSVSFLWLLLIALFSVFGGFADESAG